MTDTENIKLSTEEAAQYLGYKAGTLENWRLIKKGPKYYRPSGKVFYLKKDLDAWVASGARSFE